MITALLKKSPRLAALCLVAGCNFGSVEFASKNPTPQVAAVLPAKSFVLNSSDTSEAGICLAIDAVALDSKSKVAKVAADEELTLSAQGGGVGYYSDDQCSTAISSVVIAKGTTKTTYYAKPLSSSAFTAVAVTTRLGFNSKFLTVVRNPRRLIYSTSPSDSEGGYCGSMIRVQVQDGLGERLAFTGNLPISGLGAGAAYAAADCSGTAITALAFAGGTDEMSFYTKNMTIQAMNPTVSPPAGHETLSAQLTGAMQNKSAPYTLVLDQIPANLRLNEFSATPARIQIFNSGGALVAPNPAITVAVSATGGTALFSETALDAGSATLNLSFNAVNTKTVFVKPTTTTNPGPQVNFKGSVTYRLRLLEQASGNQNIAIVAKAIKITDSGGAATYDLGVGACSAALSVSLRDGLDRKFPPAAATNVTVAHGAGATFSYFTDPRCTNLVSGANPVQIAAGGNEDLFYVRETDEAITSRTVTANGGGFASAAPQFVVNVSRKPFTVDPAFGASGVQSYDLLNGVDVVAGITQADSGGRYIVVGRSRTSAGQFQVGAAMLTAKGDLDATFGTAGKFTDFAGCGAAQANAVATVGGGFFVAGKCDSDMLVEKISNAGAVLRTEKVTFGAGNTSQGFALATAQSPNTDVYAVGTALDSGTGLTDVAVARFNASGTIDTFGRVALTGNVIDVKGLTIQDDGGVDKLVVLATIVGGTNNDMAICRILDAPVAGSFSLDTSFGTAPTPTGCAILGQGSNVESASALLALSSGDFLAVGTSSTGGTSGFLMGQFNSDGTRDATFGTGTPRQRFYTDGFLEASAAAVFPSAGGEYLVGGLKKNAGDPVWYVARFNSTGAIDTGGNAISKKEYSNDSAGAANLEFIGGIAIGSDSKPVLAGTVGSSQRVTQVLH